MTATGAPTVCLVVPHFDHAEALCRSLPTLLATGWPVIIVDDGSAAAERDRLTRCVRAAALPPVRLQLLALPGNRGKGVAVLHGFAAARRAGFTHAVQIDADGQHELTDLPALLAASAREPGAIVSGEPLFDGTAPAVRVHGRKLTTWMIALETFGGGIRDGLCGYRVCPLEAVAAIEARHVIAPRMGFDTDMLVKARWMDIPVRFVPTRVRYPSDGRSHFHYLRDNASLVRLHIALLGGALVRSPALLRRRRDERRHLDTDPGPR